MRLTAMFLTCTLCLSGGALAQDKAIYKCTGVAGTSYGDTPCVAPQPASMRVLQAVGSTTHEPDAPLPSVNGDANWGRLSAAPLSSKRIFIGMTDTQVLNLARYGKPSRITRARDGQNWHEWWTYVYTDTGAPREVLHFTNARLVAQEEPGAPQIADSAASTPSRMDLAGR
jgi:hypothetical protein